MQRRSFLHLAGGLSMWAMTRSATAAELRRTDRIKVGQIGTSHAHAAGQLQTLQQLDDLFEVVGVVEPDEARRRQVSSQAAYAQVKWLTEEQLLETPRLQVVAVETQVKDLLPTAQRCVNAGLHIHLDKPAGESLSALEQLHETAQRKSLNIQMGYMYRFNPAFRFLFEAVKAGWLGKVFEVHGVMSKVVNDETRRQLAEYRGGSMFELGCHLIDPLFHLLGVPQNVIAFNRRTRKEQDDLLDNTLAVFEYPKATATIRSTLIEIDGGRRRQFVVCGSEGTIAIRPLEPPTLELTLASPRKPYRRGTQTVTLPKSPGRYHGAWKQLAQAISKGEPLPWSHEHDIAVQKAVLVASGYQEWS